MPEAVRWIGRGEALARLGVKTQTLYAYVSRGRIEAAAHPDDPRRSLYRASDVAALHARLLQPVAFLGSVALRAVGVAQPSEDFNVMTAADLPVAQVTVHPAGASSKGALLALAAGRIGALSVVQYDLVLTDEPLLADMPVIAVQAEGL